MNLKELREKNILKTKEDLKKSVKDDVLVIQTVHLIDDLLLIINKLTTNLRERFELEFGSAKNTLDFFSELDKFNFKNNEEKERIFILKKVINNLVEFKDSEEKYLGILMGRCCNNLTNICGSYIGAKLILIAGGLENLAKMPSSKIQVLGAEKALFRHLTSGEKPPKFGVIFAHETISTSLKKGKAARQLASKISIGVKKDYYGKIPL